jgi:malonyl-CoA O-methyltransferase
MTLPWLQRWFTVGACRRVTAQEGYALWAPTYPARPHNPVMEAEQSVVAPMIAAARAGRALDVGTGTGRNLTLLADAGARLIVGLDLSPAMLAQDGPEGSRVCADARRLPFLNASFDLVCASLMVGDVEDLGAWVDEAARVLAPGGHLVYSDFHPAWATRRWRRTFRGADGRRFELVYFPHRVEDHLLQLERANLAVRAIREPRIVDRPVPVVVAFHAVKRRRPLSVNLRAASC